MRLTRYDVETIRSTETFILRPDADGLPEITIEIQSLPPDWDDEAERELPTPQPPHLGVDTDQKGRVRFNPTTGRPIQRYNEQDPKYQAALQATKKLQSVKMFLDGIAPGQLDFSASKDPDDAATYYRAVLAELKEFGITMGDLVRVTKAIGRLSGLTDEDMEAATAGFSATGS